MKIFIIVLIIFSSLFPLELLSSDIVVLHHFNGADGADPKGTLTRFNNTLYGRTSGGGSQNSGTIFRLGVDGSDYQLLYSFSSGEDNGTGNQPHHDAMFFIGSTLYGNATFGGSNNHGSIFSIQPDGSNFQVVRLFQGAVSDGSHPHSNVLFFNSRFYGLTSSGGAENQGTIFQMEPDGSNFQLLHSFATAPNITGSEPHGRLTPSSDGDTFFGMTREGGTHNGGTIFSLSNFSSNPTYSVLHEFGSFSGDGKQPDHGYLTRVENTLYGLTKEGGLNHNGVIFSFDQQGLDYQILHTFGSTDLQDGLQPFGSLALSKYGILYGLTRGGGVNGVGTIFQILPDGSYYQVLSSFDYHQNGGFPIDNVILSDDSLTLYGMTQEGGSFEKGTIFAFDLPLSSFPPSVQNLFQQDSELVAMRSLTSMGAQGVVLQEASLIERQSNFRRAYFVPKPKPFGTPCLQSTSPIQQCSNLETFQKQTNFNVVGSYQNARFFHDQGVPGIETQSTSLVLMSDVLLGSNVFLGEAIGYVEGRGTFDQRLGKNDVKSVVGSIYSTFLCEHFYADLIGSFAWNFFDLQRQIPLWDLTASSRPQGYLGALDFTLGYYIDAGSIAITPMAGFYYTRSHVNQFSEKGADILNLHTSSFHLDSLHSMMGLRLGRTFSIGEIQFLPEIEVNWEYELMNQAHSIRSELIASDFSLTNFLPEFNRHLFTCEANLTAFFSDHCFLEFSYCGEYSHHNAVGHTLSGNLAFAF